MSLGTGFLSQDVTSNIALKFHLERLIFQGALILQVVGLIPNIVAFEHCLTTPKFAGWLLVA